MEKTLSHLELMKIAIEEQSKCTTYPKIGAVIAKDGKILATGYRTEFQGKHAERIAIEKLHPNDLIGATIVTTLEPCVEIKHEQPESPCTDIIIKHQIKEVVIGVLDPNGKIYCQGFKKLIEKGVKVNFFTPELREIVESNTFKYGDCGIGIGPTGKRRVAVIGSGKKFQIRFSAKDKRNIKFRWQTLSVTHGFVDLGGESDSIRKAIGAKKFDDITDPLVFRDPSHYARMKEGDIAIIYPINCAFICLIKLIELTETDIFFQWQVRQIHKLV